MSAKTLSCAIVVLMFCRTALSDNKPATRPAAEYYVRGDVDRVGVWPIGHNTMNVIDAIEKAGPKDERADYQITITRRIGSGKLQETIEFSSLKALRDSPEAAPQLVSGDLVTASLVKD